jgi:hypothetical protein
VPLDNLELHRNPVLLNNLAPLDGRVLHKTFSPKNNLLARKCGQRLSSKHYPNKRNKNPLSNNNRLRSKIKQLNLSSNSSKGSRRLLGSKTSPAALALVAPLLPPLLPQLQAQRLRMEAHHMTPSTP